MTGSEMWCRVTVVGGNGVPVWSWPLIGVGRPDIATVDRLARLQLSVVRRGGVLTLSEVTDDLDVLLDLAGLGRQLGRQTECREDVVDVEERVEGGAPAIGDLDDL